MGWLMEMVLGSTGHWVGAGCGIGSHWALGGCWMWHWVPPGHGLGATTSHWSMGQEQVHGVPHLDFSLGWPTLPPWVLGHGAGAEVGPPLGARCQL